MERLHVSETLGQNGQKTAHALEATECTRIAITAIHSAYLLHGTQGDFRWIEDNGDGVGEDETGFDDLWDKITT